MAHTIPMPDIPGLIVSGTTRITLDATFDGQSVEFVYDDTAGSWGAEWDTTANDNHPAKITVGGVLVASGVVGCGGTFGQSAVKFAEEATAEQLRAARDAAACFWHDEDTQRLTRKVLRGFYLALDKHLAGFEVAA